MSLKKQRGSTTNLMLAVTAATAITGGMALKQTTWQQNDAERFAELAQVDINNLTSAATRFYLENRSFPTDVAQLVAGNYYTGSTQSPYGTNYVINMLPSGNIEVTFQAQSNRERSFVLSKVRGAQELPNGIRLELGKPAREAVQSNLLHRVAIAGRPELNRMETNIDLDNNSINNVNTLNAQNANVLNVNSNNATITNLSVTKEIDFGSGNKIENGFAGLQFTSNNVTYSNDVTIANNLIVGNDLGVAGNSSFSGNVLVNGNLSLNGGSLTGFSNIQGNSMTLSGALTSDSVAANTFNAGSITANTMNVTNTLNAGSGVFNNLAATSLSATNFNVTGGLSYGNLSVTNGLTSSGTSNFNTANINNFSSSVSNLGVASASSLGVSGNVTADSFTVNNFNTTTHTSTNLNATNANFNNATIVNLNANNTVFNTATAQRIETPFLVSTDAEIKQLVVSGNMTVQGLLTSNNVVVNGSTTTNGLTATNGTINNLNAGTASFNTITATNINGGTFQGVDFVTGTSSVNTNYALIQNYISQWNACVQADGCK
jgi:hypothetical protein